MTTTTKGDRPARLGAIVLAGGQSLRMGRPKATLPFGSEQLLERVVRLVREAVGPVVVVAARGQRLGILPPSVAVVRDAKGGRGPLQGLAAGLEAIADRAEFAFATATDVPFLVPGWIRLLDALIGEADAAIPEAEGRLQPLAALYRTAIVLPAVRGLLLEDRLRVADLRDAVATRIVSEEELRGVDPDLSTLSNLNAPGDYMAALRRAGLAFGEGSR